MLKRKATTNFMSDTSQETNGQNGTHGSDRSTSPPKAHQSLFDSLANAVRKGAEDARREVDQGLPHLKQAASDAAYWTAYGVCFAAVFNWTLVKIITPERVKVGCKDGVRAGREAAENWVAEMRRRNDPKPTALLMPPITPGAESSQAGGA